MTLEEESERATDMLRGKTVSRVIRHAEREVLIEFEDGSRFYADTAGTVELSICHPTDEVHRPVEEPKHRPVPEKPE